MLFAYGLASPDTASALLSSAWLFNTLIDYYYYGCEEFEMVLYWFGMILYFTCSVYVTRHHYT